MAWFRINRIAEEKLAKTFIDDKKTPIETVEDPAEKFRFEREHASSPHGVDSPAESEPN